MTQQQTLHSDFMPMAGPLTQEELATVTGADPATIHRLVKDGHLDLSAGSGEQLRQLYKHWSEQAAGRRGDGLLDIVQERARLAREQADRCNFELRKARGEFFPSALIVEYWYRACSVVKQRMLALPSRYKALCPAITPKDIDRLDNLVREILMEISTTRLPAEFYRIFQAWEREGRIELEKDIGRHGKASSKKARGNRKAGKRKPRKTAERNLESIHAAVQETAPTGANGTNGRLI